MKNPRKIARIRSAIPIMFQTIANFLEYGFFRKRKSATMGAESPIKTSPMPEGIANSAGISCIEYKTRKE